MGKDGAAAWAMLSADLFLPYPFITKTISMDTTFLSHLNWLHILVAALAYFALGAIWYGPLFSKKWIAYQQIDMNNPDAKKGVAAIMFSSLMNSSASRFSRPPCLLGSHSLCLRE